MQMPTVLITGANRGIGFEFARQYLADGWQVYAACRDPTSASELRQLAEDSGERLRILAMDVTDARSVKAAAELAGEPIDLLLNNAGVGGARNQTIGSIDYDAWAKVLDVNTMGPLRVSEAFVEHVAQSDRKLIVTLTSGMGSIADNTSGGSIAYRSSKAAVTRAPAQNRTSGAVRADRADTRGNRSLHGAVRKETRRFPVRQPSEWFALQYARLLASWTASVGLDPRIFGTRSLRRTKAALPDR